MYNAILCRYHEIATKGANRSMFERCLVNNIRMQIMPRGESALYKVSRVNGRVWVEHRDKSAFSMEELESLRAALSRVFGLESFSPAILVSPEWDAIREAAIQSGMEHLKEALSERTEPISFRVRARRSNKHFPLRSVEMEIALVTELDKLTGGNRIKVDLDHAEFTLGCEVRDEMGLLFWTRYQGPGGLPVGSNPGVLTLLSGGIDSPVSAYLVMKRGCRNDFLTFHSDPYTPPETLDKVKRIHTLLNTYQAPGKLYACNLAEFQKLVRDLCTEKDRTVLYRRAMFRIAEILAHKIGCRALVTGEAVGQVASQTISNMSTIDRAIDMLVLRPLVGADKNDAIRLAEKIGSMELSSVQVPDSCTVFAPASPATSVPPGVAELEEAKIPGYREVLEKIAGEIQIIA